MTPILAASTILVPIALLGFIPFALILFMMMPARRAALTASFAGWLFLPVAGYRLSGLPDYDKTFAICIGIVLAALLLDKEKSLLKIRVSKFDLPIIVWCLCPIPSAILNDLGVYHAAATCFKHFVTWGLPYFVGKAFFPDRRGIQELAVGFFVAGLVYMPLCLLEIRISPQLHDTIYGFHQHTFHQSIRGGGWRPMVFLQHGLALSIFMTSTTLVGFWLWKTKALKEYRGVPMVGLVAALFVTIFLCKSLLATLLLLMGTAVLYVSVKFRTRVVMVGLLLLCPLYLGARGLDLWSANELVTLSLLVGGEQRTKSLQTRLRSEHYLVARALERPFFGWGGFGRNLVGGEEKRIETEDRKVRIIPDALWVIILGRNGIVGLTAVSILFLLPLFLLIKRYPVSSWEKPQLASVVALAILPTIFLLDKLMNGQLNPLIVIVAGATTTHLSAVTPKVDCTEKEASEPSGIESLPVELLPPRPRVYF